MSKTTPGVRYAEVDRESRTTRVQAILDLDGGTRYDISTGIHFLDHMVSEMAFHGRIDIGLTAEGDLEVDDHHTAVDVGLVLGEALRVASEGDDGIVRFGCATVPTEDALVQVSIDLRGRGSLYCDLRFGRDRIGGLSAQSVREFFRALAIASRTTIHVRHISGDNDHHVCEAAFKALGLSINQASERTERRASSATKGPRE
jgi:imidazoleglycerol-phosphate dehydratase